MYCVRYCFVLFLLFTNILQSQYNKVVGNMLDLVDTVGNELYFSPYYCQTQLYLFSPFLMACQEPLELPGHFQVLKCLVQSNSKFNLTSSIKHLPSAQLRHVPMLRERHRVLVCSATPLTPPPT